MKISARVTLTALFASFILIGFTLWVRVQQNKIVAHNAYVVQSHQVLNDAAVLQKLIVDMTAGLQEYYLSANNVSLERYHNAKLDYHDVYLNLLNSVQGDAEQLQSVQEIGSLLTRWLVNAEEILQTKKGGQNSIDSWKLADNVKAAFNLLEEREKARLATRIADSNFVTASAYNIMWIFPLACLGMIVLLSIQLKAITDMHTATELHTSQELEKLEEQIKNLESELVKAKQGKEEAEGVKKKFLNNISHEIRTPMNAIIGFTELMTKSVLDEEQEEYLQAIKFSGDNLMVIINEILDYSTIESGKLKLEQIGFNLPEMLKNVVKHFDYIAKQTGIELRVKIADDIPNEVTGDPHRLYQVLLNVIGNAYRFTEKGYVELGAECIENTGQEVLLSFKVTDSGIGIPTEKLNEIFESFTQLDTSSTRKIGGIGLGLCMVKNVVEMQGGSISVSSKVGEGTSFIFNLKYKRVALQERRNIAEIKPIEKREQDTIRVLVVEDNSLNQLLAKKVLGRGNYTVEIAENGKMAIEKLEANLYDVILMDVRMPVMDGFEASKHIRTLMHEPVRSIPIIAMTASAIIGELESCYEAGMDDFISKPFKADELIGKINKWVNKEEKQHSISHEAEASKAHVYVDLAYLRILADNENDFIKEMIRTYIVSAGEFLKGMDLALLTKDYCKLGELAHKMKSATLIVGLKVLDGPMDQLEQISLEGLRLNEIPPLTDMVGDIIRKSIIELELELEKI